MNFLSQKYMFDLFVKTRVKLIEILSNSNFQSNKIFIIELCRSCFLEHDWERLIRRVKNGVGVDIIPLHPNLGSSQRS